MPDNVHADPAIWEKVLHKLQIGAMPPREEPQPEPEARAQFIDALEGTLDAACRGASRTRAARKCTD